MSAQDVIQEARTEHIRELKWRIDKLTAENAALRDERDSLKAHFDLALVAAQELRAGETVELWDGWNLILGAQKEARDRADLIAQAKATGKRIWIVLDGKDEKVRTDGLVRVSYTGGVGAHRADKFICDFLRMAKYLGLEKQVMVRTNDKGILKEIKRIKA